MSEADIKVTLTDEHGQIVEPPPGTTYHAVVSFDAEEDDFNDDPRPDAECVFCGEQRPSWELIQKPTDPNSPIAFAAVMLACDSCHELYEAHDRPGLEARILDKTGPYWILPELDVLLEHIDGMRPK